MRSRISLKIFSYLLVFSLVSLYLVLPDKIGSWTVKRPNLKIGRFDFSKSMELKQGLDIKGGLQVVLKADMGNQSPENKSQAIESLKETISRRVDLFGVSESVVKTSINGEDYRIIIELPGVTDSQQALALIGQTAKMEFVLPIFSEPNSATESSAVEKIIPTDLTGADLQKTSVTYETDNRIPAVQLIFKDSGKDKFAKITKENVGKPMSILLDGIPITTATIQTEILNGQAILSGSFTPQEAKEISIQLNAGALPVPVSILSQKNIPPTLGAQSVQKSLMAGAVGLSMVIIFMCLSYGRMGIIASIGLFLYGLFTLLIYKLIPVVLSLPGIAGFLLSVGMAVDSNILIFERYKEEIRSGRPWQVALELAFGRAWDSIKDANTATVITGLILLNPLNWSFLNTSGSVRGFALTLLLGILISLFTGIVVTRNLLRLFYKPSKSL